MTEVEILRGGSAAEYHRRELPAQGGPRIWVFEPVRPALVLGSTQSESIVNAESASLRGVEVTRRRSGGGAVLLVPGETIWIDVVLPAGHSRWSNDIAEAPVWLGSELLRTLREEDLVGEGARIHVGAMSNAQWSRLVCFAGRGPGEVIDERGSKIIGISQRRTRDWARFQCVVSLSWNPALLVELLVPPRPEVLAISSSGASIAEGKAVDVDGLTAKLVEDLVRALDEDG